MFSTSIQSINRNTFLYPYTQGAVRSVKFSPAGPADLLIFSEHANYINIIDIRNYESRQAVRIKPDDTFAKISGITFSSDSKCIYLGTESSLLELSVDVMNRTSFQGGELI